MRAVFAQVKDDSDAGLFGEKAHALDNIRPLRTFRWVLLTDEKSSFSLWIRILTDSGMKSGPASMSKSMEQIQNGHEKEGALVAVVGNSAGSSSRDPVVENLRLVADAQQKKVIQ